MSLLDEFSIPNPEGSEEQELWSAHQALGNLRTYYGLIAQATGLRKRGRVGPALTLECRAEGYLATLPSSWKW